MKICGLQKTTLLDYPGYVAATIFLGGCNFCCPFCQNSQLLEEDAPWVYSQNEILSFLSKRKGILEGVCVTGGEPTLSPRLPDFLSKIKDLGFLIKLDTNGSRPDALRFLVRQKLVDYVAMDIKAGRDNYKKAAGISSLSLSQTEESVKFLMEGTVSYEFRTTAVKGIHTEKDFMDIRLWIKGCPHYYIQNYVESENVLQPVFQSFSRPELENFASLMSSYVETVILRGVENY